MTATRERALTGPRVSTAVICPRAASYQALGAEPSNPPSEQTLRYFQRGKDIEASIRSRIFVELRAEGHRPQAEVGIAWPRANPIGVGHADAFLPRAKGILEITSTAGADLSEWKALQAAWYALEHPRAEQASVISVDPSTYVDRVYPIDVDGLEPRIRDIQTQILRSVETREPCEGVCSTPFDGPARRCEFRDLCFASWTRDDPDVLAGLDEQIDLLAILDEQLRSTNTEAGALEAKRNELRDHIRPWIEPRQEYRTQSGTILKVSMWEEERFSLSTAKKAGHSIPPHLSDFVSTSTRERWTVKTRGAA